MKKIFYACLLMAIGCMALETMSLDKLDKPARWKANGGVTVEAADGVNGQAGVVVSHLPKGTAQLQLAFDDEQMDLFDQYQGVSFYVKGDGSDCWEAIGLLNNYNYTYYYFVPLKSTEWVKYTVAWRDFIPEGQCGMIQQPGGIPACGVNSLRIGCRWKIWYDNATIPEHSLTISDVRLEPVVNRPANTCKPAPFENVLAKLRNKEPLTIQFQGDSITAGTSLANKVAERYSIKTEELLRKWLKNDKIVCRNRAVGGARTNDERAWLPRDFRDDAPDLVTLWIGYNDKSGCNTVAYYKQSVADYIDRVAEKTKGRSAFLLIGEEYDNAKKVMYYVKELLTNSEKVNIISGTRSSAVGTRAAETLVRFGYVTFENIQTLTDVKNDRRSIRLIITLKKTNDFEKVYKENEDERKRKQAEREKEKEKKDK